MQSVLSDSRARLCLSASDGVWPSWWYTATETRRSMPQRRHLQQQQTNTSNDDDYNDSSNNARLCFNGTWLVAYQSVNNSINRSTNQLSNKSIIHHPIILSFQTQNFPISQILPSTDIWHLFGLTSRIPRLLYGFFLCFSFFLVLSYRYFLPFKFCCLRSLISPITVCFLIFIFRFFSSI